MRQALAAEPDLVCIWATTQDWAGSSPARFFAGLQRAIEAAVAEHAQAAGGPAAAGIEPGRAQPQDGAAAANGYAELRDALRPLARQGLRFVLLLDELEGIAGQPTADADKPVFDADFFSNLRALGERPEYRFGYLIASRRPLKELCRDHRIEASSFWNIFGFPQYLGLLDEANALALAREPLARTLAAERLPDPERFWRDEIKPLTGCHPCLIQLVLDKHWLALAGGYPLDPDQIGAGLRDFLEDLCTNRHGKEEWRVLIQAASGVDPDEDHVLRDLRLRGLITADRRPFCRELTRLIPQLMPEGLSMAEALKRFKEGGDAAHSVLETLERLAQPVGRLVRILKGAEGEVGGPDGNLP